MKHTFYVLVLCPLISCSNDSHRKGQTSAPTHYHAIVGLNCMQGYEPFESQIIGTTIQIESQAGLCPIVLENDWEIAARCFVREPINPNEIKISEQTIYYSDGRAAEYAINNWRIECENQGYVFLVENKENEAEPARESVKDLVIENEYYKLAKSTYKAGEEIRLLTLSGLEDVIAFRISLLNGSNSIGSSFDQDTKSQKISLSPYTPPGIYEVTLIQQSLQHGTFYKSDIDSEFYNDGNLKIIRFKIENEGTKDTTSPDISEISIENTSRSRGQSLAVNMRVKDDLSGLGRQIDFLKVDGPLYLMRNYYPEIEGDRWKVEVPTDTLLPGKHTISEIHISDLAGNTRIVYPNLEFDVLL